MKIPLINVFVIIFGSNDETVETRAANSIWFFSCMFSFFIGVYGYLFGFKKHLIIAGFAFGIVMGLIYILGRVYKKSDILLFPTLVSYSVILPVAWSITDGINGIMLYVMIGTLVLLTIYVKDYLRKYIILYHLLLVNFLILFQYYYPGVLLPVYSGKDKYIFIASTVTSLIIFVGLVVLNFIRSYDRLYNNLNNANQELLENKILIQQQIDKLKELDKIKTNFFANISHEIRTPLTLILSPVESALQGDFKDGLPGNFLENIQKNSIRLLKLVNNLLDFSKIEAGRMMLYVREVDVVKMINTYLNTVDSAAQSKGVSMRLESAADSMNLFLDVEKMDKIIMNLLSNAIKFTKNGDSIIIRIKPEGADCIIEFEDTGEGISPDKIHIIFDRFSQVDSGSTRKNEGTGIGLALVKELAELHGGRVLAESRYIGQYPKDHYTKITLILPLGKAHLENRQDCEFISENHLEDSILDRRFSGVREMIELKESDDETKLQFVKNDSLKSVLVVEDNPDMRNFIFYLLKNHYNVYTADDGMDGLEKTRGVKPDLIITDVMMPELNGYEMTRKIKEDTVLQRIPVIMLTAKSDVSQKIEGLEYGADDYLSKPFNSKELLTRMKNLLYAREFENALAKRNLEIENDLKTARLLQHKLLPDSLPAISGYRSHVVYLPMDEVGGDFYDFKANDDRIELLIADVSGHGLAAAFISLIAKLTFENIRERKSAKSVLYIINDVLCRSTVNSNYMTSFYCMISRETNIMSYTNAGHFPPVVYRKIEGEFIDLSAKGKPLGWFHDISLEERSLQLQKGDRILLYTDGITECMRGNELYGIERFHAFTAGHIDLPPEKFCETLIEELKDFCGNSTFDDDLCLLVVDVL